MIRFLLVLASSAILVTAVVPRVGSVPANLPSAAGKHKGGIDLGTGLYTREDEDIIVPGQPPLVLRRTYLSNYRTKRQFGIGTTHNGEIYLSGDFQRISLIEPSGSRITYERRSGFTSLLNAVYDHPSGPGEWVDSELRFAVFGWKLTRRDGSNLTFQGCGKGTTCSIIQSRDADGRTINYLRDQSRRLTRMQSGDRWIAFEYDAADRVVRAHSNSGDAVHYQYDAKGRLWQAFAENGRTHRYEYSDLDQLTRIHDPGTTIENYYDADGRVIRQVNRYPGDPEPLVFTLSYTAKGGRVVEMQIARSDGEASRYTFDEHRHAVSEEWSLEGKRIATFMWVREPRTRVTTAIAVTCAGGKTATLPVDSDDKATRRMLARVCVSGDHE